MGIQIYRATINPSNQVYLHSYPATLPNSQTAFTLMFRVNYALWTSANIASMFGLYNGTHDAATVPTAGMQIGCKGVGAINIWNWGGTALVDSIGYTPPNNTWIHVTYTCTALAGGTQTHRLYIDGVLNNTSTNSNVTAGTFTQTYVNGYPQTTAQANANTETANAQLDDIIVYNRQLSDDEIATIYNSNGLTHGIVYGLLVAYTMHEYPENTTVSQILDMSGNGYHLNVVNRGGGTVPIYMYDPFTFNIRPVLIG